MKLNKNTEISEGTPQKKTRKKKTAFKVVIGVIVAVILLLVVFVLIPNLGNIKAAWIWLTSSKEDIEIKLEENKKQQIDAMQSAGLYGASQDAITAMNSGEITEDEFQQIILGKITLEELRSQKNKGSYNITDEALTALENGEITGEQFIQIAESNLTLEEAVENSELKQPEQTENGKDESEVVPDKENGKSETGDKSDSETDNKKNESGNKSDGVKEETNNTSKEDKTEDDNRASSDSGEKNNVSSFTQEVIDAYKKGEITDEQFVTIGKDEMTLDDAREENNKLPSKPEQPSQPQKPAEQTSPSDSSKPTQVTPPDADNGVQEKPVQPEQTVKPPESTEVTSSNADERIAALVTKMYVLKSEYEGAVAGIVASMKADFMALPASERNKSAKSSIASGYLGQINAMEAQCDAQVDAIVSELRPLLRESGKDMSLADSILSTYASEKENTKAYYLSQYGD